MSDYYWVTSEKRKKKTRIDTKKIALKTEISEGAQFFYFYRLSIQTELFVAKKSYSIASGLWSPVPVRMPLESAVV